MSFCIVHIDGLYTHSSSASMVACARCVKKMSLRYEAIANFAGLFYMRLLRSNDMTEKFTASNPQLQHRDVLWYRK